MALLAFQKIIQLYLLANEVQTRISLFACFAGDVLHRIIRAKNDAPNRIHNNNVDILENCEQLPFISTEGWPSGGPRLPICDLQAWNKKEIPTSVSR